MTKEIEIRDVWTYNFDEEVNKIREIIQKYPYVAMDTEFPGIVARPVGDYGANEMIYQTLKCNVDMLKMIQLGLTFADKDGNWFEDCTCWQFNFKFSLSDDMFAQDSIELLKNSGIDFGKFEQFGIDIVSFGEFLMMSGLVLNEKVKWISFHSSYDFGYLLKTLTCSSLPQEELAFLDLLHLYFPCIYDVKYMMTSVEGMYGGLNALADLLQIDRIGPVHQAGSDSLLTAQTFFTLICKHMSGVCDDVKFRGELFGLGTNHTKYKAKSYANGNGNGTAAAAASSNATLSSPNVALSSSPQQLQYFNNVHYPPQQGSHLQLGSTYNGYNEDFPDMY